MSATAPTSPSAPPTSRLRVVFVIGTMGPGGAERQIVEILKRLDRTRFEPLLYLDHRIGELLPEIPADVPITAFWDQDQPHGLLLRWLEFAQLTPVARMVHQAEFFRHVRPDIVYDRIFMATMLTALPSWWCRIPRVSCVVVDPEPELMDWFRLAPRWGYRFARWAYTSAAQVVCNAEPLRLRLRNYFQLPDQQVVVAPNVINLDRVAEFSNQPPARSDVTQLITVGRLHPQKGQRDLLEALDELIHVRGRTIRLTIVGRGPLEADLRSQVVLRQLSDHVTFAGYLPNPTAIVARSDLFVLPSLYEGMPNALIEAVACGTPVIATDCPTGPREILDGGRFGTLVPPGDARALAEAIDAFLTDPEPQRTRTAAAREFVLQRFDAANGVRQLEQILASAARPTAPSPMSRTAD